MIAAGRAALLLALLCLAGCSPPVAIVRGSPEAVVLRWYQGEATNAAAGEIAERYCQSSRRTAILDSVEMNGSIELATYGCR